MFPTISMDLKGRNESACHRSVYKMLSHGEAEDNERKEQKSGLLIRTYESSSDKEKSLHKKE